jgi:hypothetical protein
MLLTSCDPPRTRDFIPITDWTKSTPDHPLEIEYCSLPITGIAVGPILTLLSIVKVKCTPKKGLTA